MISSMIKKKKKRDRPKKNDYKMVLYMYVVNVCISYHWKIILDNYR